MKKCYTIFCFKVAMLLTLGVLPVVAFGQLDANISTTDNSNCFGAPCDYNGPSIIINELMMSPTSNDGSMWGGTASQRGEWIELYNPNICEEVDISCYYLGNNANDSDPYPGGYVIPPGTVVPPAGFAMIRGVNADPVPANLLVANGGNVVELIVDGTGVCVGSGSRLWFPNSGGWFAFYDQNGVPQDAVSWATSSNSDLHPCVPVLAGCGFAGALSNYDDFPASRKNYILNQSAANFQGQSIRRIPDGGAWSGVGVPTYAECNSNCVNPQNIICNGTALVEPIGGTGPYTFLWDDPQGQTTQEADGLCAGNYCVWITDALGNSIQQCIAVEDASYAAVISHGICEGDSFTLPDNTVVTDAGEYPVMFQSGLGCDSLITIDLAVYPTYAIELNPQICENHSYTLPDGNEVSTTGTSVVSFQTIHGCDSIYTVNLTVTNPIDVAVDAFICEGDSYELPDGSQATDAGLYEILMPGDPTSCDTLFAVNLAYHPSFELILESVTDISCTGESDGAASINIVGTSFPYTFDWSDGEDHEIDASGLDTGLYTVIVSDINGCTADTSFSIAEPTPLELTLVADTLICLGDMANLLAEANGGTGNIQFHWSHTAEVVGNVSVNPDVDTSYDVFAQDANGCTSPIQEVDIDVISMDIGLLNISNDTTICPGETVSIFGEYSGNYPEYEYTWTMELRDGTGAHLVTPSEPTDYVLTVVDRCDNSISDTVSVNLYDSPVATISDELISGCGPLAVELYDPINTEPGYTHEWFISNADTQFGNPTDFVLNNAGIYEVTLVVTSPDGCTATSDNTLPIEVYETPVANFTASVWSTPIDQPDITFGNTSTGSIFSTWKIEDRTIENELVVNHTFSDTGTYAVQLFVENEYGCRDSITQWINITITHEVEMPNAFTPGATGDNPYYDPNSTSNSVFYPFSDYVGEYQMSIFNRWGELIFESTEMEMGWNGTYKDEPCPQDVYVYKVELVFADGKELVKVGDVTLFR